jgi:beta-glucosidase
LPRNGRTSRRVVAVLGAAAVCVGTAAAVQSAHASPSAVRVIDAKPTGSQPWLNKKETPAKRAAQLLAAMTLADKVHMLHGVDTGASPIPTVGYIAPIPRLHVPAITMTDGPAGVRNGQKSTEMPAPIAAAASWDTAVAKSYGTVIGRDARDLGQDQIFGPGMNIDRVPLNGRNFEYFSEDPVLSGTLAGADVRGIQSQGTIATIKHYVGNNQETNRMSVSDTVDDRTLHEIYEKNFGIAVATGNPGSVMCSYNRINTVYACSNPSTLGDLRSVSKFTGYVVSDYPATHATTDIAAGLNIELPTGVFLTLPKVQAALAAHQITMGEINDRVRETLTVLFRFGLFDRALTVSPIRQGLDNRAAQSIEASSAVLLKNDGGALPVSSTDKSIAVIGTTAKTSAQGGGSSQVNPLSVDNAYDAIVARAGSSADVTYNDGTDTTAAATAAKAANLAVVFVQDSSSEGSDRSTLELSGNQDALISAVAAANPNTVVVLETGAPALMPWLSQVKGVLEAWYPGARGGAAIAQLLFGDVDPSGKLPQTWPVSNSQVPASTPAQFPGVNGAADYSEGIDVGYRWYDQNDETPLFPFGYGLSYTHFKVSQLTLSHVTGTSSQGVTASVVVKNTGSVAGSDAVQVYVSKPHTLASTPPKELAAFSKVTLAPGEQKRVTLAITPSDLSYWDSRAQAFTVQDGYYTVRAGDASNSLPAAASYRVTSSDGPVRLAATPASTTQAAGSTIAVRATLRNLADFVDTSASVSVQAPTGWKVAATTPTSWARIKPGRDQAARFDVTVPAGTAGGQYQLTVSSKGTVDGHAAASHQTLSVTVPFASLSAAYDTVGVTTNANPAPGNWDPGGYSYSAENLAAKGVTPGGAVTVQGSTVDFPSQAPGTPDAVTTHGQVIAVGAKTAHLVLLGAATSGSATGSLTVTYTDGTTQTVSLAYNDWYTDAPLDSSTAIVATSGWNQPPGGIGAHDVSIYGQAVAVDASKTIATVTLPDIGNLHFFTVSPETTPSG